MSVEVKAEAVGPRAALVALSFAFEAPFCRNEGRRVFGALVELGCHRRRGAEAAGDDGREPDPQSRDDAPEHAEAGVGVRCLLVIAIVIAMSIERPPLDARPVRC